MKVNWINGFKAGNKKEKYSLTFRLGTFTIFELKVNYRVDVEGINKLGFRFMLFNLGF